MHYEEGAWLLWLSPKNREMRNERRKEKKEKDWSSSTLPVLWVEVDTLRRDNVWDREDRQRWRTSLRDEVDTYIFAARDCSARTEGHADDVTTDENASLVVSASLEVLDVEVRRVACRAGARVIGERLGLVVQVKRNRNRIKFDWFATWRELYNVGEVREVACAIDATDFDDLSVSRDLTCCLRTGAKRLLLETTRSLDKNTSSDSSNKQEGDEDDECSYTHFATSIVHHC